MRFLQRDKTKKQPLESIAANDMFPANSEAQRHEARAKMVLFCLNDRMRVFGPMMARVTEQIENEQGLVVVFPHGVTYGGGDLYFPTYEWQFLPKSIASGDATDPRKLVLALRASPGSNISEIMVYYLLTYIDERGDEHPMHRLPTDFRNETGIKSLLLDAIRSIGLVSIALTSL